MWRKPCGQPYCLASARPQVDNKNAPTSAMMGYGPKKEAAT